MKSQLPRRLVVSRRSLPRPLLWTQGFVLYLLLDRWHAPLVAWIVAATCWAVAHLWRGYQQMTEKPVDLWPPDQWYSPPGGGDPVHVGYDPGEPAGDHSVPMRDVETAEGPDRAVEGASGVAESMQHWAQPRADPPPPAPDPGETIR